MESIGNEAARHPASQTEGEFTHFDAQGNARMVDVSGKAASCRRALAMGRIRVSEEVFRAIEGRKVRKGDVLTVAQVAGIMGCKRTAELIPMCHLLNLSNARLWFEPDAARRCITAFCEVKTEGQTGVEMEALTGVSTALLTIYDMCKAIDKRMTLEEIRLVEKQGGKSGDFFFDGDRR
ncbi:cyclic pyranopterin monophosphate synthase MoaC [Oribacterium sp. oral taxon 102]|uniref:cyclic pyranopterin monophosphate synthase MoaC n=1 Tax=Oribacterium sp. oral taxon 102 TaxID=671214 RepID=UPI0015C07F0C|nr:cyclic pyranopterin monophosphate synthase MoaC [Oribacterium sp. oral taxon 102]NWO22219.1 cyclic pyranopterin monophosphate synthase MoaC [Oribacterium sp. oral taxon 102]